MEKENSIKPQALEISSIENGFKQQTNGALKILNSKRLSQQEEKKGREEMNTQVQREELISRSGGKESLPQEFER